MVKPLADAELKQINELVREDLLRHPLAVALLTPMLMRIKKKLDYSEYGGAPLLGLDGVCIIGHGRSNAKAAASAVRAAREAVNAGVVQAIRDSITGELDGRAVTLQEAT